MNIIVSGEAHGFGNDRWRWVSHLSDVAKHALTDNSALVICERPFNDHIGKWYVVTERHGRYNHRLPTKDEQKLIKQNAIDI